MNLTSYLYPCVVGEEPLAVNKLRCRANMYLIWEKGKFGPMVKFGKASTHTKKYIGLSKPYSVAIGKIYFKCCFIYIAFFQRYLQHSPIMERNIVKHLNIFFCQYNTEMKICDIQSINWYMLMPRFPVPFA